jgi:hypothetical protein
VNNIESRETVEEPRATRRSRARLLTVIMLVAWTAGLVTLALAATTVEASKLINGIRHDANLTARDKVAPPAPGGDLTDFLFLRRHLAGVKRFYLVLPEWERKNPFVGGAARNFTLFFLYPATAADRIPEAEAAVALDGADLRARHAGGARIERSGDISVQLLRSP